MNKEILQYYKKINVPTKTLILINKEVSLPDEKLTSFARSRRLEAVNEALTWEKGSSQVNRKVKKLYFLEDYIIGVAKPGKEAAPDYRECTHYITRQKTNNPNDMLPVIFKSGKMIDEILSFEDIFERIEKLMHSDLFGLELMGMLLFRAAFMVDHRKEEGKYWRYYPPIKSTAILEERIPLVSGIPVRVFLHFLEVLSLNEDVKVYTLGYNDFRQDYGRINTLLTLVHLIAVLLNRKSLAKFAGSFARPPAGIAPIPKTKITEVFPLLDSNIFLRPDGPLFLSKER